MPSFFRTAIGNSRLLLTGMLLTAGLLAACEGLPNRYEKTAESADEKAAQNLCPQCDKSKDREADPRCRCGTSDMYKEASYICDKKHEMTFSRDYILQYQREHYGQRLMCPECGSMKLTYCTRDPKTGKLTPKK